MTKHARAVAAALLLCGCIGACKKAAPPAEDRVAKYASYMSSYPFGGRPISWWTQRMNELQASTSPADAKLLELTIARARNAGLDVKRDGATWSARPADAIARIILDRLGVK